MDGCSLLVRSLLVAAIISTSASAQSAGIRWRPEIEAAKAEARQTGRLVLVHFWTPTCAPCRRLEHAVFNQPTVGIAIESQFVPVKLNVNTHRAVAQTYGITAVPTDVIITPDGQLVGKLVSPPTPTAYLSELTQIINRSKTPLNGAFAVGTNRAPAQPPINSAYADLPIEQPQLQLPTPVPQTQAYTAPLATGVRSTTANQPEPAAENRQQISSFYGKPNSVQVAPKATPSTQPTTSTITTSPVIPPAAHQPAPNGPLPPVINTRSRQTISKNSTLPVDSPNVSAERPTTLNITATPVPRVPPGNPPLAFDGYCPVSMKGFWQWIPGDVKWGAIHRGRTYLFVGESERQQFLADPDKFSPVLSGADVVIAVDQQQRIEGRREHGLEYNGHFFLFSTEASLQQFSSNPEKYAEAVRQAVVTTPEKTVR